MAKIENRLEQLKNEISTITMMMIMVVVAVEKGATMVRLDHLQDLQEMNMTN